MVWEEKEHIAVWKNLPKFQVFVFVFVFLVLKGFIESFSMVPKDSL